MSNSKVRTRCSLTVGLLAATLGALLIGGVPAASGDTTGSSNLCPNWTAQRPYLAFGGIAAAGKATCISNIPGWVSAGPFWTQVVLWDYESDHRYHQIPFISHGRNSTPCVKFGSATVCSVGDVGVTAQNYPPGNYHTEVYVFAGSVYPLNCSPCVVAHGNSEGFRVG